jgi:ribonuclease J
LICEDGDQIEVNKTGIKRAGQVPAGFHYIDGSAGDLDERPLEERRMLAEFGVLQISAGIDKDAGTIIQPVRLTARGWFEGDKDRTVLDAVTYEVRDALTVALKEGTRDEETLNKIAQRAAGRLLGQKYRRQPLLLAAVVVL